MAYKRRFSDDDVKLMEEDAKAASRMTAAERQMALSRNFDNRRNNEIADLQAAARERHLASRAHFVTMNPGAVSPQERAAVMQWQHDQGLTGRETALQQHEKDMLKQRGENDFRVAEQKRLGMKEQGSDAAEANGKWGLEIESKRGQNAVSQEEAKWAGQKNVADIGLKQHELEWGEGGGRERVAKIEGSSRVGAAEAQAKAVAEQNAQKNALEEQKRVTAAEKEKDRLKLQYDKLEQKDKASVDTQANALAKEKGISFDEARDQIMAAREKSQGQQGGKNVRSYRYNAGRTKRIPVYEDGSQGPAEDVK